VRYLLVHFSSPTIRGDDYDELKKAVANSYGGVWDIWDRWERRWIEYSWEDWERARKIHEPADG
jgi:hypothetical protein